MGQRREGWWRFFLRLGWGMENTFSPLPEILLCSAEAGYEELLQWTSRWKKLDNILTHFRKINLNFRVFTFFQHIASLAAKKFWKYHKGGGGGGGEAEPMAPPPPQKKRRILGRSFVVWSNGGETTRPPTQQSPFCKKKDCTKERARISPSWKRFFEHGQ